ncbi:MAG TPA: hemolysin family protein [Egibacteraceae bacterium]|nr:hemolysin family protein [Egibacteraceae bacterium]
MSSAHGWMLAAALLLVLVAAYFAAAQTALSRMTLHRALKVEGEGARRGAAALVKLMANPARTLNLLALLALGVQVTAATLVVVVALEVLPLLPGMAAAVMVTTTALFVGAEVAPKTLALQHTDRVACVTAPVVALLTRPLAPLAGALIRVGNVLAPGKGLAQGPFVTEDELREMIDVAESDEVIESSERKMIHSIFELGDTVVREIMVPRPDMVMVSADEPLRAVLDTILRAGHSRIPVYRDDRDKIVGLIYAKDVLRRLHARGDEHGPWEDLLRPPYFVPELKPVDALLRELQAAKVHLAIVVDEYGATAGLVTIEDILEEIVGEIVDEYDREEILVEDLDADVWRVDARLPVDELNDLLATDLPDEEWDTVGGLLVGLLGHVARPGERVEVDQVRLTAERVTGRRIAKVLVERMPPNGPIELGAGTPA